LQYSGHKKADFDAIFLDKLFQAPGYNDIYKAGILLLFCRINIKPN